MKNGTRNDIRIIFGLTVVLSLSAMTAFRSAASAHNDNEKAVTEVLQRLLCIGTRVRGAAFPHLRLR